MPKITVSPESGGSAVYAADGELSTTPGKICLAYTPQGKAVEIGFFTSAGESGAGSKNYVYGSRMISFAVCYVNGSEAAVLSGWATDVDSFADSPPCSIEIEGVNTYARCFFDAKSSKLEQPKSTGYGTFYAVGILSFVSKE